MAALTVQGGLVKNKMKGGVYNKPPYSRSPPLTCFSSIGTPPSANNFLFADSGVPIGKNMLMEAV